MASEHFLINPVYSKKRKIKYDNPLPGALLSRMMKTYGRKRGMREAWKLHRKGVMKDNAWFGDPIGHRTAALKGWRKYKKAYKRTRRNPFGEELIIVGANPIIKYRKKGGKKIMVKKHKIKSNAWKGETARHRAAALKGWARRKRSERMKSNAWPGARAAHRAAALKGWARKKKMFDNPLANVWSGDPMGHRAAALKGWRRRKGYRSNPVVPEFELTKPISWIPFVLSGSASAIATSVVPNLLKIESPYYKIGTQLAVALGGGYAIGKFVSKSHGAVWAVVGASIVVADLLKTHVLTGFAGLMGLSEDEYEYPSELEAYPEETISAYPEETISAYPTAEEVVY